MSDKPSVVLVHGGFVDGSGRQGVYDLLTADRYRVSVVQNPTRDRREGQAPDRREGQAQDALEVEPCLHRRSTGGHTVPNQQGGRGSSLNRISLTETSLF